jgi:regulator of replication initiation timing
MEKLNELLSEIGQKTDLILEKMEKIKQENAVLQTENTLLKDENRGLKSQIADNVKSSNIAPENYAQAPTESIKKTIDGIVSEIDVALTLLSAK